MLNGQRIRQALVGSTLEFTGAVRGNALLLTLGRRLQEFSQDENLIVEPWSEPSVNNGYAPPKIDWNTYDLLSGTAVLVEAREFLSLPPDIAGIIGTLSHVARLGLFAHFASPHVGPRFSGYLCIELLNVSGHILRLKPGMPVAKVVLIRSEDIDPESGPEAIPLYYNTGFGVTRDIRSKMFEEFGKEFDNEDD